MNEFKVVVAGGIGVGKSSFIRQFLSSTFTVDYTPTINDDLFHHRVSIDRKASHLQITDTGIETKKSLHTHLCDPYYRYEETFILLYDITSHESFSMLEELKSEITIPWGDYHRIVLVGHKCDLEHERRVTREEGEALARAMHATFFESSAMMNINVKKAFYTTPRGYYQERRRKKKWIKGNKWERMLRFGLI